jgi:hypothetical protein
MCSVCSGIAHEPFAGQLYRYSSGLIKLELTFPTAKPQPLNLYFYGAYCANGLHDLIAFQRYPYQLLMPKLTLPGKRYLFVRRLIMKLQATIAAAIITIFAAGFAATAKASVMPGDPALGLNTHYALAGHAALSGVGPAAGAHVEKPVQLARSGRRRAFGTGLAVGIIGALVAQGLSESQARARYDEEWRWDRCAEEFRSFEWDTGMYTTYQGERRLCPYLR